MWEQDSLSSVEIFQPYDANSPVLLLLVELDDVPLCEPPVVEELGHVVPDGVGQDDDALLAGLQLLRSPHRRVDGGAAASSCKGERDHRKATTVS